MLFNSFAFALFFTIVFILYWLIPHKYRWLLIWVASYYFYMCCNVKYIFLLFFITSISYFAAIFLEKESDEKKKKKILTGTVATCLCILFFFKYFNFVSASVVNILNIFTLKIKPITLTWLLPVGISFYTFQTLSYVIDVYKGESPAEHHYGRYAAFLSFFPLLMSGPIERAHNLLPQIREERKFDYTQATYGLKLMAWGYFKKIVIADTLASYTNKVFDTPQEFQGFSLFVTAVFFTIQIYCDFSGYSDIAVGVAKLLGINIIINFKSPYFSQSIKEFWSRWHISLSTWFKDYVYIPLGGNRVSKLRHYFNLIVTFLISGLWHGANWTFVVWGAIHGIAQVLENLFTSPKCKKSEGIIGIIRVVIVFVFCSVAWIFFASNSIGDAFYVISNMCNGIKQPITYLHDGFSALGVRSDDLIFLGISILLLIIYDLTALKKDVISIISSKKMVLRWFIYCVFIIWMIMNIPVVTASEFIYFQF